MKFPGKTKYIGRCIAVVRRNGSVYKKSLYPQITYKGKLWRANRLSCHLNIGPLGDKLALHTCDHKWCINPEHLYIGTARQNKADHLRRHGKKYRKNLSAAMKRSYNPEQLAAALKIRWDNYRRENT